MTGLNPIGAVSGSGGTFRYPGIRGLPEVAVPAPSPGTGQVMMARSQH